MLELDSSFIFIFWRFEGVGCSSSSSSSLGVVPVVGVVKEVEVDLEMLRFAEGLAGVELVDGWEGRAEGEEESMPERDSLRIFWKCWL